MQKNIEIQHSALSRSAENNPDFAQTERPTGHRGRPQHEHPFTHTIFPLTQHIRYRIVRHHTIEPVPCSSRRLDHGPRVYSAMACHGLLASADAAPRRPPAEKGAPYGSVVGASAAGYRMAPAGSIRLTRSIRLRNYAAGACGLATGRLPAEFIGGCPRPARPGPRQSWRPWRALEDLMSWMIGNRSLRRNYDPATDVSTHGRFLFRHRNFRGRHECTHQPARPSKALC